MENFLNLTPNQIVNELNRYIVGQNDAKKAVAIALRNRWRRKQLPQNFKDEIVPKNILMVGPTGVGKTEIARRLAKLANAPFLKIEATKFTEVGYVGRDVDSIIRDLTEKAISLVKEQKIVEVNSKASKNAIKKVIDILVGENSSEETKNKFEKLLSENKLDDKDIEIEITDNNNQTSLDLNGSNGMQMGIINIGDMLNKALGSEKKKRKKLKVKEAIEALTKEESEKLLDQDSLIAKAINLVQEEGIVFIDEIDKISAKNDQKGGEVSREGVQRDLLPLIEGTSVTTKYGIVKTDHILFIASGAFHLSKPSDLLPELQGRLPIRVELEALSYLDMKKILKEPELNLLEQYIALLKTENVNISFSEEAIDTLANYAIEINTTVENIGARRLHTILEKLLEEISFKAPNCDNNITIDKEYVDNKIGSITKTIDLNNFIL